MSISKPLIVLTLLLPFLVAGRCEQQFESFQGGVDRVSQQVGPIVEAAEPWLTPTEKSLLGGVVATAIAMLRSRKNREDARSMAKAIDAAKNGGAVDFNNEETKKLLNTVMTAGAKKIVDEAQNKVKRPMPV